MRLLDTSVAVWLLRGLPGVLQRARELADELGLPWITQGELLIGALHHANRYATTTKVRDFIGDFALLLPDRETAETYARLHADLAMRGAPIPSNDLWIAALAVQHEMPVVTSDEHFNRVAGLVVENWLA